MRILLINSVYNSGSTGRIVYELQKLININNHDCLVAFGRNVESVSSDTIKIGSKLSVLLHFIGTRLFDKHGFFSIVSTKLLIKKIKKFNPDVVHLHNIHGYYLNVRLLFEYLRKYNKPVVWTLHDSWSYTGHCAYYDFISCDKWQTICMKCPQKKSYPKSIFFDSSKSNFIKKKALFTSINNLTLVTPSKWLAKEVSRSYFNAYNCQTINNGVDLTVFKYTESNFKQKHNLTNFFIILGVANIWEDRKGLKYFIELSKTLEEYEKIVLVGISNELRSLIPKNIITLERTKNTIELSQIYSAADVFVNPTLEDNFPTTNIEALACGTPVVTFNTGGSPEIIDESTGIIVQKGSIDSLKSAIKVLKSKGRKYYSQNARERAEKFYDKEKTLHSYLELYKDISGKL